MSDILVHRENAILTLTFNRLDKKNAITSAMYAALADELERAAGDASVRVAVIQGHEEIFTAGNDLADFLSAGPQRANADPDSLPVVRFMKALHGFPKPVVAAVCGPAVGIGTTLLLHCDLIYAGDNAAFSMPFINLGVCPEFGSSDILPALAGYPKAAEKLLLGEPFYADEALDMRLINRVLPPAEVNTHAQAQAAKLAAKPLGALMTSKALMKKSQAHIAAVIEEEFKHFSQLLVGPAAREAMTAFMEKRKPDFSKC
jgi:enoyl-CoA hydratase/carnithine racemase